MYIYAHTICIYLETQKSLYLKNTKKHLDTVNPREEERNCVQFRAY